MDDLNFQPQRNLVNIFNIFWNGDEQDGSNLQ